VREGGGREERKEEGDMSILQFCNSLSQVTFQLLVKEHGVFGTHVTVHVLTFEKAGQADAALKESVPLYLSSLLPSSLLSPSPPSSSSFSSLLLSFSSFSSCLPPLYLPPLPLFIRSSASSASSPPSYPKVLFILVMLPEVLGLSKNFSTVLFRADRVSTVIGDSGRAT
jgi:hypothetical protein